MYFWMYVILESTRLCIDMKNYIIEYLITLTMIHEYTLFSPRNDLLTQLGLLRPAFGFSYWM